MVKRLGQQQTILAVAKVRLLTPRERKMAMIPKSKKEMVVARCIWKWTLI